MTGDARGCAYFSFDDAATLASARADPVGFVVDAPDRTTLDEVQRVPDLLPAIKGVVDRNRVPGRFLLTGSSNVLLLPALAESLAGRMEILRLFPFTQGEIEGRAPGFLDALFDGRFPTRRYDRLGSGLAERIAAGGYPAALSRSDAHRRRAWYRDYVETLIQRDVRDLSRIRSLDALPRLLALAAAQTARLLNVSDLASPFHLTRPTIRDYITLLERLFLLEQLPPWHSNRLSRLVKTPKLHLGDTGLACALMGIEADGLTRNREILGQLLETFVFQELRREASWHPRDFRFFHYRDKDGVEVDLVMERGAFEVAGVEVKAASSVTPSDFRGLRKLSAAARQHFRAGVVLYDGETSASFGDRLFAVPVRALWEPA
jgi:predicted AAA+ superfamily ATPase